MSYLEPLSRRGGGGELSDGLVEEGVAGSLMHMCLFHCVGGGNIVMDVKREMEVLRPQKEPLALLWVTDERAV